MWFLLACAPGSEDRDVDAPYEVVAFEDARVSSDPEAPNFQRIGVPVDVGAGPFADATLALELATTCFPFDSWTEDPPPPGQRWPAACDAFDRNFEVRVGGFEVSRAITPFGGPLALEIDVTDLLNAEPGERDVEVFIPTWSDASGQVTGSAGGWNVSARFVLEPGAPPRNVLAAIPLLDEVLTADLPDHSIAYDLPDGATSTRLEIRATGHGGGAPDRDCIGPADEFCERTHRVAIADVQRDYVPWRDDCAELCTVVRHESGFDYCAENPMGAIQSVQAPRANWCPGSLTPPIVLRPDASSGTFDYAIERVGAGGRWNVSATLYAYGD